MPRLHALALLAALTASAAAQPIPLDSLARAAADSLGLPTLVVGVSVGGERFFATAGALDSLGTAPDAHTLYEIGSISKLLTSLTLADAVVRGETTLETPVADLVPDLGMVEQHASGPIRLWHLATHTSGLPRLPLEMGFAPGFSMADPYAGYDAAALATSFNRPRAETPPGETFSYSNLGVGLLGYALARRADTSYADLVRQRVLGPLGMEETFAEVPDSLAARFAEAHGPDGQPVPHWTWTDANAGAGAWRSTASDLLTLAEAALHPEATPLADALALALAPRADAGEGRQIGLGWFWIPGPDADGLTMALHNGGTGGFVSFLAAVPGTDVAVVVLTNRQSDIDGLGVDLVRRLVAAR